MTEEEKDGEEMKKRKDEEDMREAARLQPTQSNKATTRSTHVPSAACAAVSYTFCKAVNLYFFSLSEKDGEWPAPGALP